MYSIRVKTVLILASDDDRDMETDAADTLNGTTANPDASSVATATSSLNPRLFVNNELVTSSTTVSVSGLEHFTEYTLKVGPDTFALPCNN